MKKKKWVKNPVGLVFLWFKLENYSSHFHLSTISVRNLKSLWIKVKMILLKWWKIKKKAKSHQFPDWDKFCQPFINFFCKNSLTNLPSNNFSQLFSLQKSPKNKHIKILFLAEFMTFDSVFTLAHILCFSWLFAFEMNLFFPLLFLNSTL